MNSKELYAIREWAPLTNIIDAIPERIQRGLLPANVNITSVDAIPEFIALGSDAGIVFWYNRHTGEVQKLKAEVATRITCVKIVNSVEYMVAAGSSNGQVSVFQIQKELPPDLNLVAPCTRSKPIERYTIRDLHRSTVSCCEWSKNGMKLYSGDRHGVVVLTEFDFPAHLSRSIEILSEAYEIVQLSVHQKYLLVSTLYRSIVCQRNVVTGEWQITQIGKKDRKQLIECGGTFLKRSTKHPLLICGRPGLRFWVADTDGNVERTLLFRDAVALSPTWEIPILNPKSTTNLPPSSPTTDSDVVCEDARNFCSLYLYAGQDSLMVTHDETILYILNLDRLRVEAVARGFRKIIDFCVCEKEIFILEGERSLLRLAPMPEKPNKTAKIIFNPSMPPPVPLMGASTSGTFESPVEYEPEEEAIINAEECFELPPIEAINLNIPIELAVESPRAEQNRRLEIFNQISEMDFDQSILHTHSGGGGGSGGISQSAHKKRKSRDRGSRKLQGGIVEIGRAAGGFETAEKNATSETVQTNVKADNSQQLKLLSLATQPTLMDASFCNTTTDITDASILKASYSHHLPDLLSPNTLKKTIEEKAKSLAEELNLPVVSLAPVTDEELRKSKTLASHPSTSSPTMQLLHAYPKGTQYENAAVQTTPRKKIFYLQDVNDYSDGQPVDDDELYQTLRSATMVPNEEGYSTTATAAAALSTAETTTSKSSLKGESLQFMTTQPLNDEIDSFLLDFRRACDPISQPIPASAESNGSSSEWEFLDN